LASPFRKATPKEQIIAGQEISARKLSNNLASSEIKSSELSASRKDEAKLDPAERAISDFPRLNSRTVSRAELQSLEMSGRLGMGAAVASGAVESLDEN